MMMLSNIGGGRRAGICQSHSGCASHPTDQTSTTKAVRTRLFTVFVCCLPRSRHFLYNPCLVQDISCAPSCLIKETSCLFTTPFMSSCSLFLNHNGTSKTLIRCFLEAPHSIHSSHVHPSLL